MATCLPIPSVTLYLILARKAGQKKLISGRYINEKNPTPKQKETKT